MPSDHPADRSQGSILQGTTIEAVDHGLRFDIPSAWREWHLENDARPSLHLTPAELARVEHAEGEWDHEFALVVNAILPFDRCVAHVGGEGWGVQGISFTDLQVRAYVLATTPDVIEQRARSRVSEVLADAADVRTDQTGPWRQITVSYRRSYVDYGATALVDLRAQRFADTTVVFAFMYTDHAEHAAEIQAILDSVTFVARPST